MPREWEESCNKEAGTRRGDRGWFIPRWENRIYEGLWEIIYYLTRNKMLIKCENCKKIIEKKWNRTLCIACRNIKDKIRIAERNKSPEYKAYLKQWREKRKESL